MHMEVETPTCAQVQCSSPQFERGRARRILDVIDDGRVCMVWGRRNLVHVVDAKYKPEAVFPHHLAEVTAIQAVRTRDAGVLVASGDSTGRVKIWGLADCKLLAEIGPLFCGGAIAALAWDDLGQALAIVSGDAHSPTFVHAIDRSGQPLRAVQEDSFAGPTRPCRAVRACSDNGVLQIAVGCDDGGVYVFGGTPLLGVRGECRKHARPVVDMALCGEHIVSVGTDGTLVVSDWAGRRLDSQQHSHKSSAVALTWAGRTGVVCCLDGSTSQWTLEGPQLKLAAQSGPLLSRDQVLAVACAAGRIVLATLQGDILETDSVPSPSRTVRRHPMHAAAVTALCIAQHPSAASPGAKSLLLGSGDRDGRVIVSSPAARSSGAGGGLHGSADGTACMMREPVLTFEDGYALGRSTRLDLGTAAVTDHPHSYDSVHVGSTAGCLFGTRRAGDQVQVRRVRDDALLAAFDSPASAGHEIVSVDSQAGGEPSSRVFAIVQANAQAHILCNRGATLSAAIPVPLGGKVTCLAASPDGRWVAVGDNQRRVHLFSTQNGALDLVKTRWCFHHASVSSMAWNEAGCVLATGGVDKRLLFWAVEDATKPRWQIDNAHHGCIQRIYFASNAKVVTLGDDSVVREWSVPT